MPSRALFTEYMTLLKESGAFPTAVGRGGQCLGAEHRSVERVRARSALSALLLTDAALKETRLSSRRASFSPRSCSRCAPPARHAARRDARTSRDADAPFRLLHHARAFRRGQAHGGAKYDVGRYTACGWTATSPNDRFALPSRATAGGRRKWGGGPRPRRFGHACDRPTTPAYGDALYWHGALAPTAAEAERDYRRVIVEYPLAYYADDALLAIAELEQARGDRAGALMHLQRFVKEHPASPERGVAALGAARLAFEQRDAPLGCTMIAAARASASPTTWSCEIRSTTMATRAVGVTVGSKCSSRGKCSSRSRASAVAGDQGGCTERDDECRTGARQHPCARHDDARAGHTSAACCPAACDNIPVRASTACASTACASTACASTACASTACASTACASTACANAACANAACANAACANAVRASAP